MARPKLHELPHRVREWISAARGGAQAWWSEIRRDPSRLREGALPRVLFWLTVLGAGLASAWLLSGVVGPLIPGAAAERKPTAILRLACADEACGAVFVAELPRDFSAWPTTCEKCRTPQAVRAAQCSACRAWHAPQGASSSRCPRCRAREAAQRAPTSTSRPSDPDDAEDGWR